PGAEPFCPRLRRLELWCVDAHRKQFHIETVNVNRSQAFDTVAAQLVLQRRVVLTGTCRQREQAPDQEGKRRPDATHHGTLNVASWSRGAGAGEPPECVSSPGPDIGVPPADTRTCWQPGRRGDAVPRHLRSHGGRGDISRGGW